MQISIRLFDEKTGETVREMHMCSSNGVEKIILGNVTYVRTPTEVDDMSGYLYETFDSVFAEYEKNIDEIAEGIEEPDSGWKVV